MRIETFSAAVPEFAEDRIRELFGAVSMTASRILFEQWSATEERFTLSTMRLDGRFTFAAEMPAVVITSATGTYDWEIGRESGDGTRAPMACPPDVRADSRVADADVHAVNLCLEPLRQTARALRADDSAQVRIRPRPVSPELALLWQKAALIAVSEARSGLLGSELIRARTYAALAVTALDAFAPSDGPAERPLSAKAMRAIHRRARQFIDDNAARAITVADVALTARATAEDVDRCFRAHDAHARSAEQYLDDVRMDGAHHDLIAGDADSGDSVTTIAHRWGFGSVRHFSDRHLALFGVTPAQTLAG